MNKITSTFLLLTGAFGASLMSGQTTTTPTPPNPTAIAQRRVNFLTKRLALTAAQQQQALTIFTTSATSNTAVQTSLRSARQSLRTAVQNNDVNGIDQASNTIGTLTAQLTSNNAKADAAFYQILTPDQQTKMTQSEGRGFGRPGFRGRP